MGADDARAAWNAYDSGCEASRPSERIVAEENPPTSSLEGKETEKHSRSGLLGDDNGR